MMPSLSRTSISNGLCVLFPNYRSFEVYYRFTCFKNGIRCALNTQSFCLYRAFFRSFRHFVIVELSQLKWNLIRIHSQPCEPTICGWSEKVIERGSIAKYRFIRRRKKTIPSDQTTFNSTHHLSCWLKGIVKHSPQCVYFYGKCAPVDLLMNSIKRRIEIASNHLCKGLQSLFSTKLHHNSRWQLEIREKLLRRMFTQCARFIVS